MSPCDRCDLYILAGGQSSRFGSDKALAEVEGSPLICDIVDSLADDKKLTQRVTLVTGAAVRYANLGYRVITDQPEDVGPLGGLTAALEDKLKTTGPGFLLLASCDLIRPKREWIDALLGQADSHDALAVAYRGERWEPMPALYHTDLLSLLQSQLNEGSHSFQQLLNRAQALSLVLPDGLMAIPQANTPQQLRQALAERGAA